MTTAEVHLWGRRIGAVSIDRDSGPAVRFEYDGDFVDSGVGIEPAPLEMKRGRRIYSFPDDSPRTFRGLPGMLVDCLPDKFGTSLLDRWFAEQGKNPADINIVERLLYMADRGMGALSFQPSRNFLGADESSALNINDLGYLADLVIRRDDSLQGARGSETKKIHYASWCGIAHAHRDWPGATVTNSWPLRGVNSISPTSIWNSCSGEACTISWV